ncbi:MAG: serpin family protein [Chloroflexi bacterium]|nr:serpin family protein [Chloroflexota bacterium]
MVKFLLVLLLISICIIPANFACTKVRALSPEEQSLVQFNNKFGFNLFQEVVKQDKDKNVFISPLSVAMALGMTLNGSNGTTREAMLKTLEINGLTEEQINKSYQSLIELLRNLDPKVQFQLANSIWYDPQRVNVKQSFLDLCKEYFDAEVNGKLNVADINKWVNDNTTGKITKIIEQIPPNTVMYLINAIYFKGMWTTQFKVENTKDDEFILSGGTKKLCKMMNVTDKFDYFANDSFQAVDLPYGDGKYSMTIFLPEKGVDLDTLLSTFTQDNWNHWISNFETGNKIHLALPKFHLEYEIKLNEVLKSMGMSIAFDSSNADFSRIDYGLFIDEVKHKTYVEVNEEGTEAAAVTSVGMGTTSIALPLDMIVDHPFIFVIREHHSNTILFMGKIMEPATT